MADVIEGQLVPSPADAGPRTDAADAALAPVESALALQAKAHYIGAGADRSLQLVADETGLAASVLGKWRKAFAWDTEARAYDLRLYEQAQARDLTKKAAQWEKVQQLHLAMANEMRQKVIRYFKDREIEGIPNPTGKGWAVKGMDPAKLALCLKMLQQSETTERLVFGAATARLGVQAETTLTPEQIARQVALADQALKEFRQVEGYPDPAADTDPLGEFGV